MVIVHRNCVAYDHLNEEDLTEVQAPVMSHDEGRCWHEIADGDESLQRAIGDSFTWQEILEGDYSDGVDVLIAPSAIRSDILPQLQAIGFKCEKSYYYGEDRYYFEGNEATYLKPGRRSGFSPINGEGRAMVKKAKAWSMPAQYWDWLESQPNQSEMIRNAIIRSKKDASP